MAQAIQYSAVTAFPIAVLAVWRAFALLTWQEEGRESAARNGLSGRRCHCPALLVGAFHGFSPDLFAGFKLVTAYTAAALLLLGAAISLRPSSTPRAVYLPSLAIVAAVCVAAAAMAVTNSGPTLDAFWRSRLVRRCAHGLAG